MKLNEKDIENLIHEDEEEIVSNRLTKQMARETYRRKEEENILQEKRQSKSEYSNVGKKRQGYRG